MDKRCSAEERFKEKAVRPLIFFFFFFFEEGKYNLFNFKHEFFNVCACVRVCVCVCVRARARARV